MKDLSTIKLTETQKRDIQSYCKTNNIEDVEKFVKDCFRQGFDVKKYGVLGDENPSKTVEVQEIEVIKEVIKEIRVEVPVEIIKEVIVEKPIELTKEVIVEKIIEKNNDDKMKMLQETLQSLRKELNLKNEKIKQLEQSLKDLESLATSKGAVFLKKSNLNENL
jgi:hypothetical protein